MAELEVYSLEEEEQMEMMLIAVQVVELLDQQQTELLETQQMEVLVEEAMQVAEQMVLRRILRQEPMVVIMEVEAQEEPEQVMEVLELEDI